MTMVHPKGPLKRRSFLKGVGALSRLGLLPGTSRASEGSSLSMYNYDTYIGAHTLSGFEKETGIAVKMDIFAAIDEMIAKIEAGNSGYDVIVATSEAVERLIQGARLLPLDHSRIPNMVNIDKPLRDAVFDRGRRFTMPYMWGTMGIGYRKSKFEKPVDSWKLLYDSDTYAGKISLMDDATPALGCGLKYLGYSFNSTDSAELKAVEELLIRQKKNIRAFTPDTGQDLLASGDVSACQEWNGDIAQLMATDPDINYVLPSEGSFIWQDSLAIPADAPHPENAHAFINFVLGAEAGRDIAETIQFATPNAAARALMDTAYVTNPAIFPPADLIANCETALYLGEEGSRVREEVWSRIKAA